MLEPFFWLAVNSLASAFPKKQCTIFCCWLLFLMSRTLNCAGKNNGLEIESVFILRARLKISISHWEWNSRRTIYACYLRRRMAFLWIHRIENRHGNCVWFADVTQFISSVHCAVPWALKLTNEKYDLKVFSMRATRAHLSHLYFVRNVYNSSATVSLRAHPAFYCVADWMRHNHLVLLILCPMSWFYSSRNVSWTFGIELMWSRLIQISGKQKMLISLPNHSLQHLHTLTLKSRHFQEQCTSCKWHT